MGTPGHRLTFPRYGNRVLFHAGACISKMSWTFLNRAGPGSRSIPLGFGGLNLYPSAAQAPPFGTILGFAR
jgi:hypothetical protein